MFRRFFVYQTVVITEEMAKKYFGDVDVQYFYLTTLAVPILFKKNPPKFLIKLFNGLDRVIFGTLPFLRKHAWQVVVKFSNPK